MAGSIPLKLAVAYTFLLPLILLWIIASWPKLFEGKDKIFLAAFLFVISSALVAIFGIDPLHSIRGLFSLGFVILTIPLFADIVRTSRGYLVLLCLISGQAVSGFYSAIHAGFFPLLPRLFLGKVTESGQMGLTLLVATGFLIFITSKRSVSPWQNLSKFAPLAPRHLIRSVAYFSLLCFIGFASAFGLSKVVVSLLLISVLCGFYFVVMKARLSFKALDFEEAFRSVILQIIIPCILAGLLVNLKRGPWSGILVGGGLLLFLYGRKLIVPALIAGIFLLAFVEPIKLRIEHSSRDFFIYGGRNAIWQIGVELVPKYPLGIGYGNSSFLQKFSSQIPGELKHFHNNLLNIAVETGWISLFIFGWWVSLLFWRSFDRRFHWCPLVPALGCSFLSWQIAGLVEYNVGDSEVMIVVYVLTGSLIAISTHERISAALQLEDEVAL